MAFMYASVVLRIAWICRSRSRTRACHVYFHVMGLGDMWNGGAAAVVFACQLRDRVPSALQLMLVAPRSRCWSSDGGPALHNKCGEEVPIIPWHAKPHVQGFV